MFISLPKHGRFQGDGPIFGAHQTSRAAFALAVHPLSYYQSLPCVRSSHNSLVDSLAMQPPRNHLSLVFPGGVIGDHVQRQGWHREMKRTRPESAHPGISTRSSTAPRSCICLSQESLVILSLGGQCSTLRKERNKNVQLLKFFMSVQRGASSHFNLCHVDRKWFSLDWLLLDRLTCIEAL